MINHFTTVIIDAVI